MDLVHEGHDVAVIDEDPRSFTLLGDDFPGERIVGQAIDWTILRSAGIEGTDAFAAATDGDNTNIVCALIASRAFEVPVRRGPGLRPAPGARCSPAWASGRSAPRTRPPP